MYSLKRVNFELITIGNELLTGRTLNTNMRYLAKAVTDLGGNVVRATTVGDYVKDISSAINDALSRKTDFLIMCGGLCPTFDDKTLEALSDAVNRPLELNELALEYMKRHYRHRQEGHKYEEFELMPSRLKMVSLPRDVTPLQNPVGSASGVYMKHREMNIVALPGVPREMEAIFERSVSPLVSDLVGNLFRREGSLKVIGIGESKVAPLIDKVMREYPEVYIKSHPRPGSGPVLEINFSTISESEEMAKNAVKRSMAKLSKLLIRHRAKVESMDDQNFDQQSQIQGRASRSQEPYNSSSQP